MARWWATWGCVVGLAVMGCGADTDGTDGGADGGFARTGVCTAGMARGCVCPNGTTGQQFCLEDGFGWGTICYRCGQTPIANCTGRVCGSDGADGSCGTCATGTCNNDGQCVEMPTECQSECAGRICGADPGLNCAGQVCGPNHGGCLGNLTCVMGQCVCTPTCSGRTCGEDGCGGSCGSCARGFQCGGAGACELNPASTWVITATNGTIAEHDPNGSNWDTLGGLPDPYVCLTLNGQQICTPVAPDTLHPVWNFTFPEVSARMLQAGVLSVFADDDIGNDDRLCGDATLAFTTAQFVAGAGSWGCTSAWSFTLRAR